MDAVLESRPALQALYCPNISGYQPSIPCSYGEALIESCGASHSSSKPEVAMNSGSSAGSLASDALSQRLGVIIPVRKTLYEREESFTNGILFEQLQAVKNQITNWSKAALANEPVWAIGTGRTCTPQQAQEVHALIRGWVRESTSEVVASSLRIMFGASVSSANCDELARQADVDGFFVVRAAWDVKEFSAIANSAR